MSYTTILAIYPGERCETIEELRNAWGSAPYVWEMLSQRWLQEIQWLGLVSGKSEKLWELWKRTDIPLHQRAVLMMTFDRAYVSHKDYSQAARDIMRFLTDFPPNPQQENHWHHIANCFAQGFEYPAIGFHMTSVSENPFDGPWNEEKECYDSIDWNTAYDLYAVLRKESDIIV